MDKVMFVLDCIAVTVLIVMWIAFFRVFWKGWTYEWKGNGKMWKDE